MVLSSDTTTAASLFVQKNEKKRGESVKGSHKFAKMVAWIWRQIQLQLLAKVSRQLSQTPTVHSVAKETAKLQHEGFHGAQKIATAAAVEVSKDVSSVLQKLNRWWDGEPMNSGQRSNN